MNNKGQWCKHHPGIFCQEGECADCAHNPLGTIFIDWLELHERAGVPVGNIERVDRN